MHFFEGREALRLPVYLIGLKTNQVRRKYFFSTVKVKDIRIPEPTKGNMTLEQKS